MDDLELDINDDDISLEKEFNEEIEYNDFYKKNVRYINLFFFYLDKNKNIIRIQKEKKHIDNNVIFKKELLDIIENKEIFLNKKYTIRDILKYNFNLESENVYDFINSSSKYKFLIPLKNINDIFWEKTIEKFNHLNSLYFIFTNKNSMLSKTKKIYLSKKKRKTSKKRLFKKALPIVKSDFIKLN